MFGTTSNAVTSTPTTEPSVLIKNTNPAPESLWFLDLCKYAIRIGLTDERMIRGNANNTKLPTKLPKTRSIFESKGRITGYPRHAKNINRALNNGAERISVS